MDVKHVERIFEELKAAGATRYGLSKNESKELPKVIHEDEHIGGVIYGQIGNGSSAMLVATDRRVVFLDKRPLYLTTDELTYDVVSGIKSNTAGPFTAVTLHTRIHDYSMRYVNARCASNFVKFIEKKRLEINTSNDTTTRVAESPLPQIEFEDHTKDEAALSFLKSHEIAVLSTVDRTGNVYGSVVYYAVDKENFIYIVTKSGTTKGRNIYGHGQISLTVHEPGSLQTLQIQGVAEIETDHDTKAQIIKHIVKHRDYESGASLPPVTKLQDGSFMVIKIRPEKLKLRDFSKTN